MTVKELEAKGYKFEVDPFYYAVSLHMEQVAYGHSFELSEAALWELARIRAETHFVSTRLD